MTQLQRSNDFDVRAAFVRRLLADGLTRRDIRHELTLDSASSDGRVDMALLLDSEIVGVEIKSGKDVLDRLPDQIRANRLAFDRVAVVLDKRHMEGKPVNPVAARASYTTAFWLYADGAILDRINATEESRPLFQLRQYYSHSGRSDDTSPVHMARLLWRYQACEIVGCKTRVRALEVIRERMCLADLRPKVIALMRERQLSRWEESFWHRFDAGQAVAA